MPGWLERYTERIQGEKDAKKRRPQEDTKLTHAIIQFNAPATLMLLQERVASPYEDPRALLRSVVADIAHEKESHDLYYGGKDRSTLSDEAKEEAGWGDAGREAMTDLEMRLGAAVEIVKGMKKEDARRELLGVLQTLAAAYPAVVKTQDSNVAHLDDFREAV